MRFVLSLAAALTLSGCMGMNFESSDRYRADFHYTYNLNPNGRIELENFNGPVEIMGWDENKVEIDGVKYASSREVRDQLKIEIHDSPDSIDIEDG